VLGVGHDHNRAAVATARPATEPSWGGSGTSLSLAIYDPVKHEWGREPVLFPTDLELGGAWNSFYSPELNVHVYHIAGDSRTNGQILLYRHKR
jgi:hypothetical protein